MINNQIEFDGAVLGMLLGDGSITKHKENRNSYFSICHCQEHVEYMLYKKEILNYLTTARFYENQPNGKGGKYLRCRLDTKSHPYYTKMRDRIYISGRKSITKKTMEAITPLGMALWYQDDGSLSKHEKFDQPILCTHGFSREENEIMSESLLEKFGLQWNLRKDKKYYCLTLIRKEREKFFNLVSPFTVNCMKYKITPTFDTIATRLNEKLDFTCEVCGEKFTKDFKQRYEANRFCSHECYGKSKSKLLGMKIIALENGRFKNEHGQFIKGVDARLILGIT